MAKVYEQYEEIWEHVRERDRHLRLRWSKVQRETSEEGGQELTDGEYASVPCQSYLKFATFVSSRVSVSARRSGPSFSKRLAPPVGRSKLETQTFLTSSDATIRRFLLATIVKYVDTANLSVFVFVFSRRQK